MSEYKYKVAMYYCGGCTAYFRMKENCEGVLVPVRSTMASPQKAFGLWDVSQGTYASCQLSECDSEINVYERICKNLYRFSECICSEDQFWKETVCIHFGIKENGEYTISAMKKSVSEINRFDGYIKRIHIPNNYSQTEFRDVVLELVELAERYNRNPEEVKIAIEEFRKDESVGKHRFPWHISVFKGEKRILVVPLLDHVGGFTQQSDQIIVLDENTSDLEVGKAIFEAIDIIGTSPRLIGQTNGYRLATKYKGWKTFSKRNVLVSIDYNEDGSFELCSKKCSKTDGIYDILGKRRELPSGVKAKELGENILMAYSDVCHV